MGRLHEELTAPRIKRSEQILIVSGNAFLRRSLERFLGVAYRSALAVASAAEAERALAASPGVIWHVLASEDLGPDESGIECLTLWRRDYAGVTRAVLLTDAVHPAALHLDGIFVQPGEPQELLHLLDSQAGAQLLTTPTLSTETEITMKNTSPKLHDLKTLKDRAAVKAPAQSATPALSTAQGFASA